MGGIRSIRFHNKWDTGVVIYGAVVRDTSDKAVWSDGHSIQVGADAFVDLQGVFDQDSYFWAAVKVVGYDGTVWDSGNQWQYDEGGASMDYTYIYPTGGDRQVYQGKP